jgi:hypothetical protein
LILQRPPLGDLDAKALLGEDRSIRHSSGAAMGSVKQYMRPGEYNGITYGIEVWELETGNLVVNSIYFGSLSGRKLVDNQRKEFGSVEDAFLYGAEFARNLIET